MADVELVIKIPEEDYESIKNDVEKFLSMPAHKVPSLYKAVNDGTLLSKGHGKIVDLGKIDEDRIEKDNPIIYLTVNGEYIEAVSLDYLNGLQAIIEEDKEVSE